MTFLIAAPHKSGSNEFRYSISGGDSYQPDVFRRSNSREVGTSNFFFPREALEIRIRANRRSRGMGVILYRERNEDAVHPRRDGGLDYSSLWCALTERDTDVSTIVIERCRIRACTKPVYRFSFSEPGHFLRLLPPGCASFTFPLRSYVTQDVR